MRGLIHDGIRATIGWGLVALGWILELVHRLRLATFNRRQAELVRLYGIREDTPLRDLDSITIQALAREAFGAGETRLAETSGSTKEPKRVPYTRARIRAVKWTFIDAFARAYARLPIRRKSLYVFAAIGADRSLTGLLLEEERSPSYLAALQAPYRLERCPELSDLSRAYGGAAVRLFFIAASNPGVLYATNPSTLVAFFEDLRARWSKTSRLVREFHRDPAGFPESLRRIARKLESRGAPRRLAKIAASASPLSLHEIAPGVEAYACWTGGYVRPFLDALERDLPPHRYALIPMYAMSTETIETIPHYRDGRTTFLPLAPGVLYEFLEENGPNEPRNLLSPRALEQDRDYMLVVSDAHGLRRYQTQDVFRVEGFTRGLPELRFVRRTGLAYSFTGEKLTGDHALLAFEHARREFPALAGRFLSLFPSSPRDSRPHYVAVAAGSPEGLDLEAIARRIDDALSSVNIEYREKRAADRLGPIVARAVGLEALARILASHPRAGQTSSDAWASQLKFLPLHPRLWEEPVDT